MAFGRGRPAIRSGSPSSPPNARQRNSIQSIISSRANRHMQHSFFSTPQLLHYFSRCPRSRGFFLESQFSWGLPTRGCAPGSPPPIQIDVCGQRRQEAGGQGDTSPTNKFYLVLDYFIPFLYHP